MTAPPHLPLPRPDPPPPATDRVSPSRIVTTDLALMAAAYAIETPPDAAGGLRLSACHGHLAALIGPGGRAPSMTGPDRAPLRPDADAARFEAGMWAAFGLLLAAPGVYPAVEALALTAAGAATAGGPFLAVGDSVRFGQFALGDGTVWGQKNADQAVLLRETALAGLVLHAGARAAGDDALYAGAVAALAGAMRRFRAPDGGRYAHAVTPERQGGFGRDVEAEALLGLLCLRLRADDYADELLDSVERYACSALTDRGPVDGYAQGNRFGVPRVSLRGTLLVAVFQREAGRSGQARQTLRGLQALRTPDGLLADNPALTVAADAAFDSRYLTPPAEFAGLGTP